MLRDTCRMTFTRASDIDVCGNVSPRTKPILLQPNIVHNISLKRRTELYRQYLDIDSNSILRFGIILL